MSAPRIILAYFNAIILPKVIKIGGHLTKFWQKQFCSFWPRCIKRRKMYRASNNLIAIIRG